jgi:dipeptidase D
MNRHSFHTMTRNPVFDALEPQAVWRHFATLCAIPRPSKHEAALMRHLQQWAKAHDIAARRDATGNLILAKPATPGRENAPGIILQGHVDMVCERAAPEHDFLRDPIRPEAADGWLMARHTTLGADNGIGVALALAAAEDAELPHGPLEILLTVDEEAGMGGAHGLEAGSLRGRFLLNLDTEEWGAFYLGCAGGVTLEADFDARAVAAPLPPGAQVFRLQLEGLVGGHSGIDIHRPRAHAIRQMLALLTREATKAAGDFPLLQLQGGTVFNALPRSAFADLALAPAQHAALADLLARYTQRLQLAYPQESATLTLTPSPASGLPEEALAAAIWRPLLRDIAALPFGVAAMSRDFPGVVETSNNLAPLHVAPGHCRCSLLARSQDDAARDALAEDIARQIHASGGSARFVGAYPGWKPDPASILLQQAQTVYRQSFAHAPRLEVIHAGLECGLFARSHPQLEMLSFGPDIRGAHAPGERVNIASVGHCWRFLRRLLTALSHPMQGRNTP